MLRAFINDAKSVAGALIGKYLARASVAVPFFVALGFATAAITMMLVERLGAITAYWVVAGGFAAIGLVATLVVGVKKHEEQVAQKQADVNDTIDLATDAAAQAAVQAPLALMGALLSTPTGPSAIVGADKVAARNWPMVLLLVLIAALFWPAEEKAAEREETDQVVRRPNGASRPSDWAVEPEPV
jgi:hypothetical protein